MPVLTPRLLTIANMIGHGTTADIGADHALLSIYLVKKNLVHSSIVTDINSGPLLRASQAVNKSGLSNYIQVRQGNGLRPIASGEADTIIIAGMGGTVISEIIADDWDKSESFKSFILQPMTKPEVLRAVLAARGWPILDERAVRDRGKWYVIMQYCPGGQPYALTNLALEVGPNILMADSQLKRDYISHWRNKYLKIYQNLVKSTRPKNEKSAREYEARIRCLEDLLNET
ncbi:MAG TPA: class I SAM-dependent methyltransferase [Syntrophomonadaceae bacterium]|nr:class I SAM-dependent methyltransferase [Syntrophomonadaceae bacterium]